MLLDLASIYFSNNLTQLDDPQELRALVKNAYNTMEKKRWDEEAAVTKDGIMKWENTNYWTGFHKHM